MAVFYGVNMLHVVVTIEAICVQVLGSLQPKK